MNKDLFDIPIRDRYFTEAPTPDEPNKIKMGDSIHITQDNVEVSNTKKSGTKDKEHPHDTYKIKPDSYLKNVKPMTGADSIKKGSIPISDDIYNKLGFKKPTGTRFRNAKSNREEKYRMDATLVGPDGKEDDAQIHAVYTKGKDKNDPDSLRDRKVDHWKKSKKSNDIKEGVVYMALTNEHVDFLLNEVKTNEIDFNDCKHQDVTREYIINLIESNPHFIYIWSSKIFDYEDDMMEQYPEDFDLSRHDMAMAIFEAVREDVPTELLFENVNSDDDDLMNRTIED